MEINFIYWLYENHLILQSLCTLCDGSVLNVSHFSSFNKNRTNRRILNVLPSDTANSLKAHNSTTACNIKSLTKNLKWNSNEKMQSIKLVDILEMKLFREKKAIANRKSHCIHTFQHYTKQFIHIIRNVYICKMERHITDITIIVSEWRKILKQVRKRNIAIMHCRLPHAWKENVTLFKLNSG